MSGKVSFKSLLADNHIMALGRTPYGYKEAQMNPDDTQFEQDFSKLAFMFVQDRAQGLMPYMLGFETVQRSSDGSKAVGIFGFKIGNTYYYIPAFFMNNQVKGVDMILNKSTNMFMPLTEEWVDYITNNKSVELGDVTNNDKVKEEFENPDFNFMETPNSGPGIKASSFNDRPYSLREAWDVMKSNIDASFEKDSEFQKAWVGFVTSCNHTKYPFKKEASISSGVLGDYIKHVGGPRAISSLMKMASSDIKSAASVCKFYDGVGSLYIDSFSPDCYLLRKRAEESATDTAQITITDTPSTEQQARDVIEDGFTIVDNRSDDRHSTVYLTEYDKKFFTPDKPGIYNVLTEDGDTVRAKVLFKDRSGVFEPSVAVIADGGCIEARPKSVIAIGDSVGTASDIYHDASPISSIEPSNIYVFVSKSGSYFGPYNVFGVEKEPGKRVVLRGYEEHIDGPDGWGDRGDFGGYWGDRFHTPSGLHRQWISTGRIEIASIESDTVKDLGSKFVVPSNWGVFKINRNHTAFRLGDDLSLDLSMQKKAFHRLGVTTDGPNSIFLRMDKGYNTPPMSYKQASIKLVSCLGLHPVDAKSLLKQALAEGSVDRFVKFAQATDMAGVTMGAPAEPTAGVDPYTGIPTYDTPFEDLTEGSTNAEPPPDGNEIGENIGGDTSKSQSDSPDIDSEAKKLVQQAAELGQKNVFDHAAVGGLSKVYDTGAVVDSYIPNFMQTLDRLGRVLFLYYWKHDDFLGRYGSDDVVEMEDLLRGVFKSLGKLTMELKSKAISKEDAEASAM